MMFMKKKKLGPISIPNIKKSGSSLNSDSLIRPSDASSKLRPITPRSILSPKPSTMKFDQKSITDKYLLNINDFEPFNKVPISGGCGIIYFVRNKKSGKRYAVKTSKQQMNPEANKSILRELNILMKIQHPTIVHFEGFSLQDMQGNNRIMLFIDFIERGTLADIIEKEHRGLLPKEFDNTKRQIILIGIAYGMMILHKNNVINRDLKPHNILIDDNFKPLITDFSLSKFFNPQNSQSQSVSCIGTYAYMAPEIIESNNFNTKADVYAFGILMYEFVTGSNAIENIMNKKQFNQLTFFNHILSGKRPTFDSKLNIKPGFQKMIEQCWSNNPKERPDFSEIFSKLSLNESDLYIDSEDNICQSIIKCENEDSDKSSIPTNYCYDDVDFDEIFEYIKEISKTTINTNNEEIVFLKQNISHMKDEIDELKRENSNMKIENEKLKNNVAHFTDENTQIKNDITELKKIIIQLQNKPENDKYNNESLHDENMEETITYKETDSYDEKSKETDYYDEKSKEPKSLDEATIEKEESISFDKFAKQKKEVVQKISMELDIYELAKKAKEGIQTKIELPQFLQKIPDSLFKDCRNLLAVKIPSSVIEIGNSAFFGCTSLERIIIPSSVSNIGEEVFTKCFSLNNIIIVKCENERIKYFKDEFLIYSTHPDKDIYDTLLWVKPIHNNIAIPSFIKTIGSSSFCSCSSVVELKIPSSVSKIGNYAFSGCQYLTHITIPSSVNKIGSYAFSECSSLTEIAIPSSVTLIEDHVFSGCSSLTKIEIPSSVTQLGSSVFSGCSSLRIIKIPSSVTKIGDHAFFECLSLKQIPDHYSVANIEDYAFVRCSSFRTIEIPSSVTQIGDHAFSECTSLTKIEIPSSIKKIGDHAFSECSSLTKVDTFYFKATHIGSSAFSGCSSLTNIDIPSSVTKIGDHAFSGCSSLTEIYFSSNATQIGSSVFSGCSSLTKINISSFATKIEDHTFSGCSSLRTITIPSSVTQIGDYAFSECSLLKEIAIPSSVIKIGDHAFSGCSSLTEVKAFNSRATHIGSYAFSGCSSLTKITIPYSVTKIGDHAFSECSSLTEIKIPSSLTEIGPYAFDLNVKLIKV